MRRMGTITHIAYVEERYRDAARCLAGIRARVQWGWSVTQIKGDGNGPFVVIFSVESSQ